jgi:hypothetical protein
MTVKIGPVPGYKEARSYPQGREAPSSEIADRFEGVVVDEGADNEQIHRTVNAFIEMFHLLERLGWYDHTSDWDFHIGVELTDGRTNNHIGDGAEIEWLGRYVGRGDIIGLDDNRAHVKIGPNSLYEEVELEEDPLKEFRTVTTHEGLESEYYYVIPIEKIRSLTFGYCT